MTPPWMPMRLATALFFVGAIFITPVLAQEDSAELAKKLSNPVAALISVPFQLNYDEDIGPAEDGKRFTLNVQPVIPFEFNRDGNIIWRNILPVVWQDDIFPGAGRQFGIGDLGHLFHAHHNIHASYLLIRSSLVRIVLLVMSFTG